MKQRAVTFSLSKCNQLSERIANFEKIFGGINFAVGGVSVAVKNLCKEFLQTIDFQNNFREAQSQFSKEMNHIEAGNAYFVRGQPDIIDQQDQRRVEDLLQDPKQGGLESVFISQKEIQALQVESRQTKLVAQRGRHQNEGHQQRVRIANSQSYFLIRMTSSSGTQKLTSRLSLIKLYSSRYLRGTRSCSRCATASSKVAILQRMEQIISSVSSLIKKQAGLQIIFNSFEKQTQQQLLQVRQQIDAFRRTSQISIDSIGKKSLDQSLSINSSFVSQPNQPLSQLRSELQMPPAVIRKKQTKKPQISAKQFIPKEPQPVKTVNMDDLFKKPVIKKEAQQQKREVLTQSPCRIHQSPSLSQNSSPEKMAVNPTQKKSMAQFTVNLQQILTLQPINKQNQQLKSTLPNAVQPRMQVKQLSNNLVMQHPSVSNNHSVPQISHMSNKIQTIPFSGPTLKAEQPKLANPLETSSVSWDSLDWSNFQNKSAVVKNQQSKSMLSQDMWGQWSVKVESKPKEKDKFSVLDELGF